MPSSEEEQVQAMLDAIGIDMAAPSAEADLASDGEIEPEAVAQSVSPPSAIERLVSERRSHAGGREVSIGTLVHLLGLPTATQVSVIEAKVDELTAKMNLVLSKLERLHNNLQQSKSEATLDRVDYQLSDLRAVMKKVFPKLLAGIDSESAPSVEAESRAKVLSSGNAKSQSGGVVPSVAKDIPVEAKTEPSVQAPANKPAATNDALEEFENADGAAFQSTEGRRIRTQTSQGVK